MTNLPKPLKPPYAESLLIAGIITVIILVGLPLSQILSDSITPPEGPVVDPIAYQTPPDIRVEPPDPPNKPDNKINDITEPPPQLTIDQIEVLINPDLTNIYRTNMAGILPSFGIEEIVHEIKDLTREPRPVRQTQPIYPPPMRTARISGNVWLEFVVGKDGITRDIKVLDSSHKEFESAAAKAVRRWVFTPGEKDGQPVNARVRILIPFNVN